MLSGVDPSAGVRLRRSNARLCAFDLTLSAPKSVSLSWALGNPDTAAAVIASHEHAVDQTIAYLEREAIGSRRGHDGVESVVGGGVIGAAFRHRTSRAGDPQLHTHVLVANATLCEDGVWRALDGRVLYAQARTAGFLYQAELRHGLTQSLGVSWENPAAGQAEMVGFDNKLLREFSSRRIEIEHAAVEAGDVSVQSRRRLAVTTRRAKDYDVDPEQLRTTWENRADLHGVAPGTVEELLTQQSSVQPTVQGAVRAPAQRYQLTGLEARDGLLAAMMDIDDSTFDRRGVIRLIANYCPAGATVADIEARADRFLAGDQVQEVGVAITGVQYATVEHLALEQRVLDAVEQRRDGRYAVCPDPQTVLATAPELSDEQLAMVTKITTDGAGVSVVVGAAGTGKTHALAVARQVWANRRYAVIGCALAARTAAQLQSQAGIPSCSLDRLLATLDRDRVTGLRGSVIVVDEAAMIGTRKLARLLDHAGHGHAKVVLVGDHHQLPAIEAGGVFAALARGPDAVHLTENRRNRDPIERQALTELRDGDISKAFETLVAHGRVHVHATKDDARAEIVASWHERISDGDSAFMLASRHDDVDNLNQHARSVLQADGRIGPDLLEVDGRPFAVGDSVMTLTNDYRLGVLNGQRGTIANIDQRRGSVTVTFDDKTTKTISAEYLEEGGLDHAYAMTIHKAQGQTCDYGYVLGDEHLYREAGYSALTRGRNENHLHTAHTEVDVEIHHDPEPDLGYTAIVRTLDRSRQRELAIDRRRQHELEPRRNERSVDQGLDVGIEL